MTQKRYFQKINLKKLTGDGDEDRSRVLPVLVLSVDPELAAVPPHGALNS